MKEKIIIASNRVPYNITKSDGVIKYKKSVGGLVTAIDPILLKNGGLWIGWNGYTGYDKDFRKKVRVGEGDQGYSLKFISLSEKERRYYYHGFSNKTLWPLFHGFILQSHFDLEYWKSYKSVNKKFAVNILEEISGKEMVWIQDYHLTLVPRKLRKIKPDLKLLFFLHIPFPNYEIFRVLPWDKEILEGLLGCDLIGFQNLRDATNFLDCCKRILNIKVSFKDKKVYQKDRTIDIKNLPISIDFERFNDLAGSKETDKYLKNIKRLGSDVKIILSVERLDYTKGIKERLLAINRFLKKYPKYRKKVVFLQISVPSRTKIKEYITLKREIDEMVGSINGRFGDELWSPINYLYKALPQTKLIALYKISDICLVTPLRDGMNLIAKEYVSCKAEENGILILSEFAGAAEEMKKYSILVNPYDIEEVADSINKALNMHGNTKKMMISRLRKIVQKNDIYAWANNFINYSKDMPGG
ncbi:MAG: trehalose-6-phosphate synthase [Actinobacteria bacterium]|nr:trehalose-6-phosphate synthase [Actinomycetota bacterium]